MKKIFLTVMLAAAVALPAFEMSAKTDEEKQLVEAMNAELPVYMGNGTSWTEFDIADNGDFVVIYTSNDLPAADKIDDAARMAFEQSIHNGLGANKGMVEACKATGRSLQIKVYNQQKELCLDERFSLDSLK